MPNNLEAPPAVVDFTALLDNLDRQNALYEDLLALSDQERVAIGHTDLATLTQIVATKERIVAEAQALEQARDTACARWAQHWGMDHRPTLDDLRARATSADVIRRLDAAAIDLSRRVTRLRHINGQNAQLLTQVQRLGDSIISVAMRYGHHPLYDQRGDTMPERRPSLIFDYRA